MKVVRRIICGASCGILLAFSASAQPAVSTPAKSPVSIFRELLAMTPEQRERALATRPPEIRERLVLKLQEYQIMPPGFREQKLQETELRWYLLPLMSLSPTNRASRLAQIPEELRKAVEERLQQWDIFPPPLREQLLNSEIFESAATKEERDKILAKISPERRAELEAGLENWRSLSEEQRKRLLASFNRFFELTPEEKEKALDTLPDEDRQQMEKTLNDYANLSPTQRARCIQSFEKFASMSLAERQAFLKNAERWKEMSPAEREAWRHLVNVAPIMPPENPPVIPTSWGTNAPVATN